VRAARPRRMTVVGDFFVRGGIHTVVTATHEEPDKRRRKSRAPRSARQG